MCHSCRSATADKDLLVSVQLIFQEAKFRVNGPESKLCRESGAITGWASLHTQLQRVAMGILRPQDVERRMSAPPRPRGPQDPTVAEQLSAQTQVDAEHPDEPKPAPPGAGRQLLVVMRHGQRIDEVDPEWPAQAPRPFDPYLTEYGEKQARDKGPHLTQYAIKHVYVSPFHRCLQTTLHAMEAGPRIPPEKWTVTTQVCEFLNPHIMVKKGASVPAGHINEWFWEGDVRDHLLKKLPKDVARRMQIGQTKFYRFPENLYQSRKRYIRSFQEIADEAQGENVLVVTHGDAVNASVSRIWPWAIVHPVTHTGYTVASRERRPDGNWSRWRMDTRSGEAGVWWRTELQPAFHVFKAGQTIFGVGQHIIGGVLHIIGQLKPF